MNENVSFLVKKIEKFKIMAAVKNQVQDPCKHQEMCNCAGCMHMKPALMAKIDLLLTDKHLSPFADRTILGVAAAGE